MNREQWLTDLSAECVPFFKGFQLKPFRVTMGWPIEGGRPGKRQRVGECHALESSTGGFQELFISPVLEKPLEVAGVVCHELAHVAAGMKAKHGTGFVRVCKHVGLTTGKPTAVMPGEKLNESLQRIVDKLGEYPHKKMKLAMEAVKPGSGVVLVCECGFRCSTSQKWITEVGVPTCACGNDLKERE